MSDEIEILPEDLDDAVDILLTLFNKSVPEIEKMTEDEFSSSTHFWSGMFIRNSWYLWWFPNHGYKEWPIEQPKLNKWFQNIGITHADDMSGIIMTTLYRKIHNLPYDLDAQVKRYQDHWKEHGYEDGIPRHD